MKFLMTPNIRLFFLSYLFILSSNSFAQYGNGKGGINTVNSAVPFLRIIPDARGGAMGDVGIATSVDPNTTFYNASKLAFSPKKFGLSLSYAPWLRALGITDIYMTHFSAFYKVSRNDVIHTSLKFFSLGDSVQTRQSAPKLVD